MNDIVYYALYILVVLAGTLITRYLVPFIKSKLDTQKLNHLMIWAEKAVCAVEQSHTDKNLPSTKKECAMEIIEDAAAKLGLKMSDSELETLLEAFVHQLNQGKKDVL